MRFYLSRWLLGATVLFFILSLPAKSFGQNGVSYGISSSVFASTGDELPFWLYANTDGTVDPEANNLLTNFYSKYSFSNDKTHLRLESGFQAYSRFSEKNALFFTQLYGQLGYHFLNLTIGRFYNPIGMNDNDLSMGSMEVSRNATPIPKIELSTNGFTDVPLTQGYVQFKAMLAHGWLGQDRYVSNPFLHQKYLYLKVNYKIFEGIGGIIHNVTWGGTHPQFGKLPSSFSDYLRVVTGLGASQESNAPNGEMTNVIGNSVAAYDFRLNVNLNKFQLKAYRLFYLEDKVSTRFRSPWDGMWGLGIELNSQDSFVNEVLWEHMNTKRQDSFDWEPRGTASYYSHFLYRSGWTYEGNVIGNPLLLDRPNSNFVGLRNIYNNIIIAHHIGIKGRPADRFRYKFFFTYSRNYGTVNDQRQASSNISLHDFRVDEYSTLFKARYLLNPQQGLSVTAAVALDVGDLYKDDRFGIQLGIRWDHLAR
ncbi:MAG: capsule assembly Wzi family protein [Balneolaceae bacterium]|jgi:hypothetical protein